MRPPPWDELPLGGKLEVVVTNLVVRVFPVVALVAFLVYAVVQLSDRPWTHGDDIHVEQYEWANGIEKPLCQRRNDVSC